MNRHFTSAVVAGALLVASQPDVVHGQSAAVQRRLAAAERLDCSFSALATGTWQGGAAEASVTPAELEIAFFDINVDEGSAEAEGAFGASFISARYSQGYLHLMQVSDAGPLYVTTVFAHELPDDRLMAVHVRLEYAPMVLPGFTSRPEMYVGSCSIGA
jgi:hypothetical protein